METFRPIAMRCTQEQFEAVRPKLRGLNIHEVDFPNFRRNSYLTNNLVGNNYLVSNISEHCKRDHNREVHEEWNEEIFLKACGIKIETPQEKELLNNKNMVYLMGYSVLVDNEEQARKLQETAFEQGFKWVSGAEGLDLLGEKSFQFGYNGKKVITYNYGGTHYKGEFITKTAHFNDLFKEETLQEKAIRLENELNKVKQQIEEENKPKIGDWVFVKDVNMFYKKSIEYASYKNEKKITNPELIKLLEQEIK